MFLEVQFSDAQDNHGFKEVQEFFDHDRVCFGIFTRFHAFTPSASQEFMFSTTSQ